MRLLTALLLVACFVTAILPVPVGAVSYGAMGTRVLPNSTDFIPTLATTLPGVTNAYLARRDIGVAADHSDDAYYVIFGDGLETAITTSGTTFRLTCGVVVSGSTCGTASAAEGRWVTAGDADVATPNLDGGAVLATLESRLHFLESDGISGWTLADGLYVDADGSSALNAGDVRLVKPGTAGATVFSCTTCPVGRIVQVGDTDLTEGGDGDRVHPTSLTFAAGAFVLAHWDGDNNGAINPADIIYVKGPSADSLAAHTIHPDIGDMRLLQSSANRLSSTLTHGSLVVSSSTMELKSRFEVIDPRMAITNTADPDLPDQYVFMHFTDPDTSDNHLLYGDLSIYRAPSGGGGVLVTSKGTGVTSPGTGTAIDTDTASLVGQVRYYDLSPAGYSANDPIYLKRPGNAAAAVEVGDLRVTGTPACTPSCATAAGVVKVGDSDVGFVLVADANFRLKHFNTDGASYSVLRQISSTVVADAGTVGVWDASEPIYIGAAGALTSSHKRFYHPNAGLNQVMSGGAGTVNCTTAVVDEDCPSGASPVGSLTANTNLRVTGPDSAFDVSASEQVVDSTDDRLGPGDVRIPAGTTVSAGDAETAVQNPASGDVIVLSNDAACAATCTAFMRVGDVYLFGGTYGSRVTASSTGFIPVLTQQTVGTLTRYNRIDPGSAADDTFYLSFGGALPLQTNDIRITPFSPSSAGTLIKTGDANYAQEVTGGASFTRDTGLVGTRLCYIDLSGLAGLSATDPVYAEVDTVAFGAPFGATGTLNAYDLRLTPAATYSAGTILVNGNTDLTGQTTCATPAGGLVWYLRTFDANGNGRFDAVDSSSSNDDVAYLALGATLNHAPPPLHAIRLSGGGGASAAPSGSTAGSTSTSTQTTSASSSTSSTDTSSSSTDTSTSSTATSTDSTTTATLAAMNQALANSLVVKREGGTNVLTWDDQDGEDGYNIFSADSPFVLLTYVNGDVTTYRDEDGSSSRTYLVTAVVHGVGSTADDVNNGDVPGYSGVPTGEKAPASKKGFIPAPGLAFALLAVGLALVLVRRKL